MDEFDRDVIGNRTVPSVSVRAVRWAGTAYNNDFATIGFS